MTTHHTTPIDESPTAGVRPVVTVRVRLTDCDDAPRNPAGTEMRVELDAGVDLDRFGGRAGLQRRLDHPRAILGTDEPSSRNVVALADALSGERWPERLRRWAGALGLTDDAVDELAARGITPLGLVLRNDPQCCERLLLDAGPSDLLMLMTTTPPWSDPVDELAQGRDVGHLRTHVDEMFWWAEQVIAAAADDAS